MIKFEDFFKVDDPDFVKVKFNMNDGGGRALDLLLGGDVSSQKRWNTMISWRTKQSNNSYGSAKYVLTFAQYYPYGLDYYLFDGMYEIHAIKPDVYGGVGYKLIKCKKFEEYSKRVIVKLNRSIGRDIYNRKYSNIQNTLNPEIYEVKPFSSLGNFPGYSYVSLTHKKLQIIFNNNAPEWKIPLSSVKAVYCITDMSDGKLYIGSATGNSGGLWQRWSNYANINNLTGGNKAFIELKQQGNGRIIDNFQYSILEVFDPRTDDHVILERESYWKRVFKSKDYGLNEN